jgi:queuine tRNA-ribosyltransferase
MITFEATHSCGRARRGVVRTPHGEFETPAFMPVATKGTVKTLAPDQLREIGVQIVLSNTYHLAMRPGDETIEALGGLHAFMKWNGPILTDSGGFQVFSLARVLTLGEPGVEFRSHIDGAPFSLSPERALDIQLRLGSDIIMPLDQPIEWPCRPEQARDAMDRTHRWLTRTLDHHADARGRIFGIVQGAFELDLRDASVDFIAGLGFPGLAVGGLSMGEPNDLMVKIADHTAARIPADRVRYLMGVGTPADIVRAIAQGIDLFDCVLPTRVARNGAAFTSLGLVKLRNRRHASDAGPLDPECACRTCAEFSRAYLRHCFNVGEVLGLALVSYHNLFYYMQLMRRARAAIIDGTYERMLQEVGSRWGSLRMTSA